MSLYDDVLGAPDTASRKIALDDYRDQLESIAGQLADDRDKACDELDKAKAEQKGKDAEKVRTFPTVINEGIQSFREQLERAIRDQD